MRFTRILFFLGLLALAAGMGLLAWLYLPSPGQRSTHVFLPTQLAPRTGEGLLGQWTSELDSPRYIVLGRAGQLRLRFQPVPSASDSSAAPQVPATYDVVVEARAAIPSTVTNPSGLSTRVLALGQPVDFEWEVSPRSEGSLEGRVWLYLRYIPKDGGDGIEKPLSAQSVIIRSLTLFGRTAKQVQLMALIALALGTVLVLPHIVLLARRGAGSAPNPS